MTSKKRKSDSIEILGTTPKMYGPTRAQFKPPLNPIQKTQVARMINAGREQKVFDTAINITNVSYAGFVTDVSAVPQGVTEITRVGDNILPKRLKFRGGFVNADTQNTFRVIVFRWKQNDTVAPTVGGIVESSGPSTQQAVYVPLNVNTRDTFEVLKDKTFSTYNSGSNFHFMNIDLKLAKKKMQFSFSTTAGTNKIYMLFISDSSAVTHPTVTGYARLVFTDS